MLKTLFAPPNLCVPALDDDGLSSPAGTRENDAASYQYSTGSSSPRALRAHKRSVAGS